MQCEKSRTADNLREPGSPGPSESENVKQTHSTFNGVRENGHDISRAQGRHTVQYRQRRSHRPLWTCWHSCDRWLWISTVQQLPIYNSNCEHGKSLWRNWMSCGREVHPICFHGPFLTRVQFMEVVQRGHHLRQTPVVDVVVVWRGGWSRCRNMGKNTVSIEKCSLMS